MPYDVTIPEVRAEAAARAWELRKAGCTIRQISSEINVTRTVTHRILTETLREYQERSQDLARETVTLDLARCDQMMLGVWKQAVAGDIDAIRTVLAIMERRHKMLGIEQAAKIGIFITAPDDSERMGALEELKRELALIAERAQLEAGEAA